MCNIMSCEACGKEISLTEHEENYGDCIECSDSKD